MLVFAPSPLQPAIFFLCYYSVKLGQSKLFVEMSLVANYTDSEEEDQGQDLNLAPVQPSITPKGSSNTLRNPFGVEDVERPTSSDSSSEDDEDKTDIMKGKK